MTECNYYNDSLTNPLTTGSGYGFISHSMFEGLIAIIEAWFTREISERRESHCNNGGSSTWEETDDIHSSDAWADLGDLRDVYNLLEQIVERIHSRD